MRNGQGTHWFGLISHDGVAIMGGIAGVPKIRDPFAKLPPVFVSNFRAEPAFLAVDSLFCFTLLNSQRGWTQVVANDDIEVELKGLFDIVSEDPKEYQKFAAWHYDKRIDSSDISRALRNERFGKKDILRLNSEVQISQLEVDMREIGYEDIL